MLVANRVVFPCIIGDGLFATLAETNHLQRLPPYFGALRSGKSHETAAASRSAKK